MTHTLRPPFGAGWAVPNVVGADKHEHCTPSALRVRQDGLPGASADGVMTLGVAGVAGAAGVAGVAGAAGPIDGIAGVAGVAGVAGCCMVGGGIGWAGGMVCASANGAAKSAMAANPPARMLFFIAIPFAKDANGPTGAASAMRRRA